MLTVESFLRQTHGRWDGILSSFGLDEQTLSGKHTRCPLCRDGKDRFRYDNKDGQGKWICNQCGSGDGLDLIMGVFGCDLKTAMQKIGPEIGSYPLKPAPKGPSPQDRKKYLMSNVKMWKEAEPNGDLLLKYLTSRGIKEEEFKGADLRLHVALPFYDEDGNLKGKYPAMLASISDRKGKLACIHRTYIHQNDDGSWRKTKKISKASIEWSGGSIRLFSTQGHKSIIIGEGIETALSMRSIIYREQGVLVPCWAAVSANNMERMALPEHIENVLIAADSDESYTGQKAAYTLANRLVVNDHRKKVRVRVPNGLGVDMNDELGRM